MKKYLCFLLVFASLYSTAQTISTDDFQKGANEKGTQILDVRTPKEFQNGHLKNSLQADWNNQEQFRERVQYLDKSKPVYVYCAAGVRSNAAAKWMRENGFSNVKELKGGINAWNADKRPTEGVAAEPQVSVVDYNQQTASSGTVLVDFGAPWCPPCVQMEPIISSLQREEKFKVIKYDPTVQVGLAGHLKIDALPAFLIYKNGKEVYRKEGMVSKDELKKALQKKS